MVTINILILTALVLTGCGQHSSSSQFFQKAGDEKVVDESKDPKDQMQRAIFDGDTDKVKKLIENNFKIDQVLPSGRVPLAEAAYNLKTKIIRLLISLGATPATTRIEEQPLLEWCEKQPDSAKLLRALLKTEDDDQTEFSEAVIAIDFQGVKTLLQEDINPNFIMSSKGESPLTFSIKEKMNGVLRALFSFPDLNVNLKNVNNESPLALARKLNQKAVVSELLKRDAVE